MLFRSTFFHNLTDLSIIGAAGDWQDDGACTANVVKQGQFVAVHYESKSVPLTVPVQTPKSVPKTKNSRVFSF